MQYTRFRLLMAATLLVLMAAPAFACAAIAISPRHDCCIDQSSGWNMNTKRDCCFAAAPARVPVAVAVSVTPVVVAPLVASAELSLPAVAPVQLSNDTSPPGDALSHCSSVLRI